MCVFSGKSDEVGYRRQMEVISIGQSIKFKSWVGKVKTSQITSEFIIALSYLLLVKGKRIPMLLE